MTEPECLAEHDRTDEQGAAWRRRAVASLRADQHRSADTHLQRIAIPGMPGVDLYLKDESTHPTGSLKHRLARSLFLHAICNGWIGPNSTVVEASSGSTAVSEAHYSRMLGLPFVAVMARATSPEKIALIESEGGRCHLVADAAGAAAEAQRLARECGGHYMDQFTYAERATDWRGNNNIAESTLRQLELEPHPEPTWVVVGAGTGGTSATFGRYLNYRGLKTRLCVVDPEGSAFYDAWCTGEMTVTAPGSRIEGIGRPSVEPSFLPGLVDRMIRVPDTGSVAAMRLLADKTGLHAGPSTGTNLYGALLLAARMHATCADGSIVTLMCDGATRYGKTHADDEWIAQQGWDCAGERARLERAWESGEWR